MKPEITTLNYTYKKEGQDVWVLNFDDIPVEASLQKDRQIVHLGPGSVGGNHKHSRTEWFIGIGELVLMWLDETGKRKEELMHPDGEIRLIKVPPLLPHAVVNRSESKVGVLFEIADAKMRDVTPVTVVA